MNKLLRLLAKRSLFVEDEILGLDAVIRPGDVCLDVGAEYGIYSHVLARLTGLNGTVHSIEPLPGAFRVLTAGLTAVGCGNVRCHQVALGEQTGHGTLSVPRRRGLPVHGRAFLTTGADEQGSNTEFTSSRGVTADVLTLDELCAREGIDRVDFIKADVEGAELSVLRGGEITITGHCPTLLLEIEERHVRKYGVDAAAVVDWLTARGYQMRIWDNGAWHTTERVTPARRNYLFTHPDRAELTSDPSLT
jgi:FkbM family methyltransferase